jgi:23S rRNA-/tRNA-specific pseudouridylate synthase
MTKTRIITSRIPPLPSAQSLASYCAGRFSYLSEDQWQKEISEGKLSLDGVIVLDPATTLRGGEMLAWDGSCIVEPEVDDRITILYEDEWFVAVDKPGNLPVHPSGRYFNNTLRGHKRRDSFRSAGAGIKGVSRPGARKFPRRGVDRQFTTRT